MKFLSPKSKRTLIIKDLTEHELVLQKFLNSFIGRSKLASMIYGVIKNNEEGIGFSETPIHRMRTPEKSTKPSCSECKMEELYSQFVPEAAKAQSLSNSEPIVSE